MKISIIVFPGTNCEHDIEHTYGTLLKQDVKCVWHRDSDIGNPDIVIVPGGFSYGDYLRPGALARISPIMDEVKSFAGKGGPVLGICNGFQILCEVGLLPGALLQNRTRRFLSRFMTIEVEQTDTPFTSNYKKGDLITCPVAHFDGNYFADEDAISRLDDAGQVVFRYRDAVLASAEGNPNGSVSKIAGVCNQQRNVVGLMPHPERVVQDIVGSGISVSALGVFQSSLQQGAA